MYFIAMLCGIAVQSTAFTAYFYNSIRYIGTPSEKLQYYTIAIIPIIATSNYTMALVNYGSEANPVPELIHYFLLEWSVVTPLFISNVGRILHLKLYKYFILTFAVIAMNILGYVAYTLPQPNAFGAYAAAGLCYLTAIGMLLYEYRKSRLVDISLDANILDIEVAQRVTKWSIISICSTWPMYPVAFILLLCEVITLDVTILTFVLLDILSKSVLTSTLLGYYDYINNHDSFLQSLVRPKRVVPLNTAMPQKIEIKPRMNTCDEHEHTTDRVETLASSSLTDITVDISITTE